MVEDGHGRGLGKQDIDHPLPEPCGDSCLAVGKKGVGLTRPTPTVQAASIRQALNAEQ